LALASVALAFAGTLVVAGPAAAVPTRHHSDTITPMSADKGKQVTIAYHTWNQQLHLEGHSTYMNWAQLYSSDNPLDYPTGINCTVQSGYIFWQNGNGTHSHWSSPEKCSDFKADPTYIFSLSVDWGPGTFCVYQYFVQYAAETPGTCAGVSR
jgi:hypothetical protein